MDIKVCGLTCLDDARRALDYGADCLGFVLYGKSPRSVSRMAMLRLLDRLDVPGVAVAVLVNETRAFAESLARDGALRAVQLHGDEQAVDFVGFPLRLWRAMRFEAGRPCPDPEAWKAERFVVDAHVPDLRGGTGVTADWPAAADLARRWPVMLAGGLTPVNVAEAIRRVRPAGVDVASGVEQAPGRKDPVALREFIRIARQTGDE